MNDLIVSQHFGTPAAIEDYIVALDNLYQIVGAAGDGKDILKLDQTNGQFYFGQTDTPLDPADLIAVNPMTFRIGYIAFNNKEVATTLEGHSAEMLVPLSQYKTLPLFDDLPELVQPAKKGNRPGGGTNEVRWMLQLAVDMAIVEGPNTGVELAYKPTSQGGHRALQMVGAEISRRIGKTADTVPLIEARSTSYTNRNGKLTFSPDFALVGWTDLETMLAAPPLADEAAPAPQIAAKLKTPRKAAVVEPEPEEVDEAASTVVPMRTLSRGKPAAARPQPRSLRDRSAEADEDAPAARPAPQTSLRGGRPVPRPR